MLLKILSEKGLTRTFDLLRVKKKGRNFLRENRQKILHQKHPKKMTIKRMKPKKINEAYFFVLIDNQLKNKRETDIIQEQPVLLYNLYF